MRISDWSSDVCSSDLLDVDHAGSANGCREAVAKIAELQPDIVLLDIKMRDGTGFDVLNRLSEEQVPGVIFTTAFDHFAVRAFDAHSLYYIHQPTDSSRLTSSTSPSRDRPTACDGAAQKDHHHT